MFSVTPVAAVTQPYVGGYFYSSDIKVTNKAVFCCYFDANASLIPADKWLCAVMSVEGGNGTTLTATAYQLGLLLSSNNTVNVIGEEIAGGMRQSAPYTRTVGSGDYCCFYGRTDITNGYLTWKVFCYASETQFLNDNPTIYSFSNYTWDPANRNLLVGHVDIMDQRIKYFQVGVESNDEVTNFNWAVSESNWGYYNGSAWCYLPAYSVNGVNSFIDIAFTIGGEVYTGVDIDSIDTNMVIWEFSNATVADGTQLWSGSGVVRDYVSIEKPYQ